MEQPTDAIPDTEQDQDEPRRPSSLILFLSGVGTFSFLGWLCWLVTTLVIGGIPEGDRADLVASLVFAASGVVVSAAVTARTTRTNPLEFLITAIENIRSIGRR